MGDQGFGVGKLQLEVILQEPAYPSLDLIGLVLWPREAEQEVVGVPYVPQAAVVRVVRVVVGQRPHEGAENRRLFCTSHPPKVFGLAFQPVVFVVSLPLPATVVIGRGSVSKAGAI